MTKEVKIQLSEPAGELPALVSTLGRVLKSKPTILEGGMGLLCYAFDEDQDEEILRKIRAAIGAYVIQVLINGTEVS